MAQVRFYFSTDDWNELFNYLQANKGKLIPDVFYDTEQYLTIESFSQFVDYQENQTVHFFLTNEKFTIEPLVISRNQYIEEPKYKINQRAGGPYLDISYYRGFTVDAVIPYKMSYLEYYPNFIHFNDHTEFKASDALKKDYNDIVKYVKKKCKVIIKDNRKYLISHSVLKEIGQ